MAFWLARERQGQASDWIARFDPRFWTVNFPRPAMASLVATGPDALRVDCVFHHRDELVGLIWDSQDTLSHPLLGYATQHDYRRGTLKMRWRSGGLRALDQTHGPTLTIEGRDATGQSRSWFVRLWNYAVGTPEDARITLPFSELRAGFAAGGEPVEAADIDRMFVSLVAPGYDPVAGAPLPTPAEGWVELSEIRFDGAHALLEIGDAMVPPHGEQMATAYDDAFNQSPQRLVRTVRALGYRGDVLHYLGMSHFYALERGAEGLKVAQPARFCTPAVRWHAAYLAALRSAGFGAILSLSYELFAEHCPAAWQQRAHDGSAALTGWEPPSTLLSPAHHEAMAWLQAAGAEAVGMQLAAGLPARFQIGEPWWWTTPQGQPCLYDDAAQAALGGSPVTITDLRAPLTDAQQALLAEAGRLLAASTLALRDAVRVAAGGQAEVLLLAFTPTILDPATRWSHLANLPDEWAWPAFDRLQLEDYDWLVAGDDGLRRAAYGFVDERLGYPADRQDYLSGFVLLESDADAMWPRIDAGLDEAAGRGIARRFVWALPQVCRDGYTRLPAAPESAMQPFHDVSFPLALGRETSASPEFSTTVALTASGHERRNALWSDARMHYDVGPGLRSEHELGVLLQFFRARRGPAVGFRLRDPFDHSSAGMTDLPGAADQLLGVGNGRQTRFDLVKSYGEQRRRITRPVPGTVRVCVGGEETDEWVLLPGGVVELRQAPLSGASVSAGFLFDVPVRFAEDRLDVSGVAFAAGEAPSVPLIEIREAV